MVVNPWFFSTDGEILWDQRFQLNIGNVLVRLRISDCDKSTRQKMIDILFFRITIRTRNRDLGSLSPMRQARGEESANLNRGKGNKVAALQHQVSTLCVKPKGEETMVDTEFEFN